MATFPLITFLTIEKIESLASRSNLRFGKQILKDAKIIVKTQNTFRRVATVQYKNNPIQTVEFLADHKGLHFKCSCANKKNFFCEHCTAVALSMNA
jgi:hypothetical protein